MRVRVLLRFIVIICVGVMHVLQHEIKIFTIKAQRTHTYTLLIERSFQNSTTLMNLPPKQIRLLRRMLCFCFKGSVDAIQGNTDADNTKGKRKFE